jgi:hypothetical protein
MQNSITAAGFHRMPPKATKATNEGVGFTESRHSLLINDIRATWGHGILHKDTTCAPNEAGLLSVDRFSFRRVQYFSILGFAG